MFYLEKTYVSDLLIRLDHLGISRAVMSFDIVFDRLSSYVVHKKYIELLYSEHVLIIILLFYIIHYTELILYNLTQCTRPTLIRMLFIFKRCV